MDSYNNKDMAWKCAEYIRQSKSIVLLSGAGMSTAAGIPDFRGPQGLYRSAGIEHAERLFDIDYFFEDPSFYYSFHRTFLKTLDKVRPTFTHEFFAALEQTGKFVGIITQNIDSLHQRAGSKRVLEIHGGTWSSFCTKCGKEFDYETSRRLAFEDRVPFCDKCKAIIKPDIVFYGEPVKHIDECKQLACASDLFFVVGSSLVVTPAAILPSFAPGKIVVVNKGEFSSMYLPSHRITIYANQDIDTFFRAVNEYLKIVSFS